MVLRALSPWVKITGNVQGGDYNEFNGDTGNYPDRPDVMIVGNHHAREWMSYEVPMMVLETIEFITINHLPITMVTDFLMKIHGVTQMVMGNLMMMAIVYL